MIKKEISRDGGSVRHMEALGLQIHLKNRNEIKRGNQYTDVFFLIFGELPGHLCLVPDAFLALYVQYMHTRVRGCSVVKGRCGGAVDNEDGEGKEESNDDKVREWQ